MNPANIIVSVQREDFCAAQQQRVLLELAAASGRQPVGALATFVGLVRAECAAHVESFAGVDSVDTDDRTDADDLGVSRTTISGSPVEATGHGGVGMGQLLALEIEHYPAMTEVALRGICDQAFEKWQLVTCCVIHRVGRIPLGEQIVLVMVAAAHRSEAFAACEYIMDYLKTAAPFWKKAVHEHGEHWVAAKAGDSVKAAQW